MIRSFHLTSFLLFSVVGSLPTSADTSAIKSSHLTTSQKSIVLEANDILRFANNDTLHGVFLTFNEKGKLLWRSFESPDVIPFETKNIQRVILNKGKAYQKLDFQASIRLINGDVIPGEILGSNADSLTINTQHLGKLTVQRKQISTISPTPFGGKILYFGPLSENEWKTVGAKKEDTSKKTKKEKDPKDKKDEANTKSPPSIWQYASNAWYCNISPKPVKDGQNFLTLKQPLPDRYKLSFNLAWKKSLYLQVILHADFAQPKKLTDKEAKKNNPSRNIPQSPIGRAYVLHLNANGASLTSQTYDQNNQFKVHRFTQSQQPLKLFNADHAKFELLMDKENHTLLLYVNDEFKGRWNLGDTCNDKGNILGFTATNYNHFPVRISEVSITNWNGMKDSAQSMTSKKKDVILLNNGLDRFSGSFKKIENNVVFFVGNYNNSLRIPLNEVREIHLATDSLDKLPESTKNKTQFFIYPYGRITGTPSGIPSEKPSDSNFSQSSKIQLKSDLLGNIFLDTNYLNLIDFTQTNSLLELWDDNF